MKKLGLEKLIRPLVRELHAYVPGEQPDISRLECLVESVNTC